MKKWRGCFERILRPMRTEGGDGAAVPNCRRKLIGAAVQNAFGKRPPHPAGAVESGSRPVHVRWFCPGSDLAACVEIYYRTRSETFTWLPRACFRRSDFLADTFDEELFVAEVGGKVAGFAGVYAPDDFLHHLYVAREYQGRGVASTLLQYLLNRSGGRLRLKCLCKNERALAFYRRQGLREGDCGWDAFGQWVMLHGPAPAGQQ